MPSYMRGVGYMAPGSDYLGNALPTMSDYSGGGYKSQGDWQTEQNRRLGDLERQFQTDMGRIGQDQTAAQARTSRYAADRKSVIDRMASEWADSFGVNRKFNALPAGTPTRSYDMDIANANREADAARSAQAREDAISQRAYGDAWTNAGKIDLNARRQDALAEAQSNAGPVPLGRSFTPGIGYSSAAPNGVSRVATQGYSRRPFISAEPRLE